MDDAAGLGRSSATDRTLVAVGGSIGLLVLAFIVFLQAGHDQSLGPLDLETAQRLALVMWVTAPIAGGLALRRAALGTAVRAGVIVCLVVGLAIAFFPTSGFGGYTCSINLPAGPLSYMLGRLAVGASVGLGMATALVVTTVATRRLLTALPGVVLAGIANYVASLAAYVLFYEGVRCL